MPTVVFVDDQITKEVPAGARLLEITQDAESNLPFGCEDGACATCVFKPIEGGENLSSVSPEVEKETIEMIGEADGMRLACQCIVNGDVKIQYKGIF